MMNCSKIEKMLKIKILLFSILLFSNNELSSQIIKFRSSLFSSSFKDLLSDDMKWEEWSEWEKNSVLILFDSDNERIKLYANETKVFDIIETKPSKDNEYLYKAVDNKGEEWNIDLYRKEDKKRKIYYQIYIRQWDSRFTYILKLLDE
jgi:hypothetical protein